MPDRVPRHDEQYHEDAFPACEGETAPQLFDDWFDPIESVVRERARQFIEELIRGELDAVRARPRYERSKKAGHEATPGVTGYTLTYIALVAALVRLGLRLWFAKNAVIAALSSVNIPSAWFG